ncbi:MAG: metallophosphoesterase family protein [Desulfobacca sp.]|uniref:metallophosphoesterase family protein n=1 Tax=Desulfobacca sp. TaxID=2067990 RepID=UPI00404B70E1
MLLGLISDSHGDDEAIQAVTAIFHRAQVDKIFHLGDDYEDILFFQDEPLDVVAVPGLYCPAYRDPAIPNRRREEIAGVSLLLTHSPKVSPYDQPGDGDPQQLAQQVDLVLYGHTHIPKIHQVNGVWWINPGHLKASDNRGWPPSYGLLRLEPPTVVVQIVALSTGEIILDYHLRLKRAPQPA